MENAPPAASKEPDTQERPVRRVLVADGSSRSKMVELALAMKGDDVGVIVIDELPDDGIVEIPPEFAGKQVVLEYGQRRRDLPKITPHHTEAIVSPATPAAPQPIEYVRAAERRPSPAFARNLAVVVSLAAAPCRESDRATEAITRRNRSGLNAHFPSERGPNWLKMALNSQR